jgi:alpha-1,6-mannosyltransferase
MKTLHLTNYWHASSGGIATFYRALMEAAGRRANHEIVVVAPAPESRVERVGASGRIVYLRAPRAPFNRDYRLLLPHRFLMPGGDIARLIAKEEPDVVGICDKYTLNYLAGLLRRRFVPGVAGRPAVAGLSCERMDDGVSAYLGAGNWLRGWIAWYLKWLYFPLFDFHITVSPYAAAELRVAARGHAVPRGVWVLPMGVDLETFSPALRSEVVRDRLLGRAGGGRRSVLLLYCGRLAREKNPGLLLDMLERLASGGEADYRLVIAGDGAMRRELEQRCAGRLAGRVCFLGHLRDRRELAALEANCDVFVHPNPREPFGIGPLEAMASGLPVVAPASGGVLSYAGPRNAWLATPDGDAFARSVRSIVGNPEDRRRRIAEALRTAASYSWPAIADRFLDLYGSLPALLRGGPANRPALEPAFVSTPGNRWGAEAGPAMR